VNTTNEGIRVKSSIESLRGLIDDVKAGNLRLPAFQRSFTWRNDQMVDLFDSVAQGYPIGSLFLWNTMGDHVTSDHIGPFGQPGRKSGAPVSLVIDGQHRLVTLVGVLLAGADADDRWRLYYDPRAERFCHAPPGRQPDPSWVRVANLLNTLGVLQESRRLLAIDPAAATTWVNRIERVARAIAEYQIPVIGYSGDLNSAVEVFARLNQKGKTMGPDELLSALTYRETDGEHFRLADQIDSILEDIEATAFGSINRTFVLRAILAAADLDIYSRDWSGVAKEFQHSHQASKTLLKDAVNEARRGLLAAVDFLQSEKILSIRHLSYGMQLVALSAFLGIKSLPNPRQRATLSRMLWVSSFTAWFGPPAQERALVRELRSLARNDDDFQLLGSIDLDAPALPIPSHIDRRSARVRALINVLIAQNPRRPDGTQLEMIFVSVADTQTRRIYTHGPKDLVASPANRVIAVTSDGGAARSWLCKIHPEHRDHVLRSLGIPAAAFALLESNDAEGFLQARHQYLDQLEREFMAAHGVTQPKQGAKPAPSPIDTEE
jgi:hypothetical protein